VAVRLFLIVGATVSERVIFFSTSSFPPAPPGEILARQVTNPSFRRVDAVDSFDGFLDSDRLRKLVVEAVGDEGEAGAFARFVEYFDSLARHSEKRHEEVLSTLEKVLEKQEAGDDALSPDERAKLLVRLRSLVKPRESLARQAKAEELASVLGRGLEKLQVICDLRPIFDAERKVVEGVVPVTTLKLVVENDNGLTTRTEVRLTLEQVNDLADQSAAAKAKLDVLEEFLAAKEIERPRTE